MKLQELSEFNPNTNGLSIVAKNSSRFINSLKHPLVRGISNLNRGTIVGSFDYQLNRKHRYNSSIEDLPVTVNVVSLTIRKDRKPRNSGQYTTELIDNWFEDMYGFRPRANGVFSFLLEDQSIIGEASYYGPAHIILPDNNARTIFGERVFDFYDHIKNEGIYDAIANPKKIDDLLSTVKWHVDGDFEKLGREEFIFTGDNYYVFDFVDQTGKSLTKQLTAEVLFRASTDIFRMLKDGHV